MSLSDQTPGRVFGTWLEVCRFPQAPTEKVVLVGVLFFTLADSSLPSSHVLHDALHDVLDNSKGPLTESIEGCSPKPKLRSGSSYLVRTKLCF